MRLLSQSFVKRLAVLGLLLSPIAAHAEGKSIIVLDGSGSMWGQIDGRPKLEIARDALKDVLQAVPADTELGLIAYGHRTKGDCDDIEVMVAPAKGTADAIAAAASQMQFLGKTPLTEAVRRAAAELRSTEEKATVILITDGIETCNADPCALGKELEASGVDFTAHVVGFGLTADEGKQVACLAENTGGKYIEAKDATSLTDALKTTVAEAEPVPAPEPEPTPPAALEINFRPTAVLAPGIAKPEDNTDIRWELFVINSNGETGESLWTEYNKLQTKVEPGTYRLVTSLGEAAVTQDVSFTADAVTAPEIVLNAARLILRPIGIEGGPTLDDASVNVSNADGVDTTDYGEHRFYLPAGEVTITGKMGATKASEIMTLAPGDLISRDFLIASGVAAIEGYYVEGMKMEDPNHSVAVVSAKQKIDGSREDFGTTYGMGAQFTLPPGDYIAIVKQHAAEAEAPFSVKVGERVDVSVVLNAGVINVKAPGANGIEILDAKTDLNGNNQSLAFDYSEEVNKTVTAGEVLVRANWGDIIEEQKATVTPGERTEVTLTKP